MDAIVDQIAQLGQKQDLVFGFWAAGFTKNELLVDGFSVSEGLSQLPQIEVSLVSTQHNIDLHKLIDAPATIVITLSLIHI